MLSPAKGEKGNGGDVYKTAVSAFHYNFGILFS